MKRFFLTATLLCICLITFSQDNSSKNKKKPSKGYANIGLSTFLSKKLGNFVGPTFGAGANLSDYATLGLAFDFFLLQDDRIKMVPAMVDFRIYFKTLMKDASPFFAVQPGYILHNERRVDVTEKGSSSISIMGGLHVKPKSLGFTAGIGYSNFGLTVTSRGRSTTTRYSGAKIYICLAL